MNGLTLTNGKVCVRKAQTGGVIRETEKHLKSSD